MGTAHTGSSKALARTLDRGNSSCPDFSPATTMPIKHHNNAAKFPLVFPLPFSYLYPDCRPFPVTPDLFLSRLSIPRGTPAIPGGGSWLLLSPVEGAFTQSWAWNSLPPSEGGVSGNDTFR